MTLSSSIPVLRVSDYPRARAFWTRTLGFSVGGGFFSSVFHATIGAVILLFLIGLIRKSD